MAILATTTLAGMRAHALPAFVDNYIWLLQSGRSAIVLDPGDDAPINAALQELELSLGAIFVTHHHPDHIGRLAALETQWHCPVYGPDDARIPAVTQHVHDGMSIELDDFPGFIVWHVPGHTRSHVAYLTSDAIFVGDTLFGAGCGRVFEGEFSEMYASLSRIAALPAATQVFCSHEYTRRNLEFAAVVEPGNPAINARRDMLSDGRASVPFRIGDEHESNVFLRCLEPEIERAVAEHAGHELADPAAVFAALRTWKNQYG